MTGLDALFAPSSVAVLGVSRSPAKLGHRLLQNVLEGGFGGRVFPVNPAGEPILGVPSVPSVAALPEPVDLALVSLPAPAVPAAIEALAAQRARAAVVLSSGFGEVDDDGRSSQRGLLAAARAAGLRLVGPNCMGVYSAPARLNGTYFWDLPRLEGGISIVSQSGAYGGLIFRGLGGRGLGVARFLSIGNQADVDVAEVLAWLGADPRTSLVVCFVEALRDGRRFVDVAARVTARKPVVVLKGGRSDAGRRAAGSHTGSLAGAWDVYRAAFRRAGVVAADETDELFDAVETLAAGGARRPRGRRVAVLTVSGGPSVVAADTAEREGLLVPALDDATQKALRALLPPFAAVGNPVDLTPQVDPARIADVVRLVLGHPEIDGAIAIDVGLDIAAFAGALVGGVEATGKPAVAFVADAPGIAARLAAAGIPVLPGPERAVRGWRALWLASRAAAARPAAGAASRTLPEDVAAMLTAAPAGPLPYRSARRLLEAAGVAFCREAVAASADEAVRAADALGYPVVVKADAPGLTHRTEVGGVRVGLASAAAVREACDELAARAGARAFVVQEQRRGVELLLGARRDEVFGPVVALGVGGVLAEVLRDVSLRLAPLAPDEAEEMLAEGARPRLLAGPRGLPAVEPGAVVDALRAVADLIVAAPRIREIDVNPVIAAGARAVAVDALVVLDDPLAHGASP